MMANQGFAQLRFMQVDKAQARNLFFTFPVPTMRKSGSIMTGFG